MKLLSCIVDFFFQDQRQAILMEMESKAALAAAKENAEALARARQECEYDEDEDGDLKDAIVVDLEDSECSTDSIGNSNRNKNKRHHHRKRRRSESAAATGSSEVIEIEPVQPKKVTFRELGIEIGRRWKALQEQGESSQKLTRYRELADADAARYHTEMDEYHRERVSAMCRGGNLGHRYNEARETVEAQQALQAQEAVAVMKAAMGQEKSINVNHRASAPPQGQPQGQAQAQDLTFPGGMMPMMMMMPNPLNPTQMMPCMMMMAAPAGRAMPMPMPMGMPMSTNMPGMPAGMMMMPPTAATPSTTQKQIQDQAQPSALVQNQPETQPATNPVASSPPPAPQPQQTQPQRKGFFPSIGPSLEILEDFDEFPTAEDPPLPNNNGLVLPTDRDANQLPLFQQNPREHQEPANKKSKMDRQDDLLDMSFDDAALMAISKDNDAFNKLLHSIVTDAAATKKPNNVPIKTVTVHKHHSHHKHRHHKHRNVDHHPKSDKKKRGRRESNTSVDTTSLMNDIAKAFGEDWDPTPVKVPKNISFQTKVLEHSAKASTLAAAAGQSKTNCNANATVYQNFDQMMDSLETYNYESDVSGFHDLFDGADKDAKDNYNKPFFPTFDPTKQDGNVFASTERSDANANTSEAAGAQPFFPCIDTKAAIESGFLNNNVTTDIATLNKKALYHGRSTGNTKCSLDSADRAAGATSTSFKPTANEVVDLTTDNVIDNLQELLQRQQAILGMRI